MRFGGGGDVRFLRNNFRVLLNISPFLLVQTDLKATSYIYVTYRKFITINYNFVFIHYNFQSCDILQLQCHQLLQLTTWFITNTNEIDYNELAEFPINPSLPPGPNTHPCRACVNTPISRACVDTQLPGHWRPLGSSSGQYQVCQI